MVLLAVLIIINIFLLGLLTVKPLITTTTGGKVLAFLSFLIFPVVIVAMGLTTHLERARKTEFCLSCHIMEPFGKSLHIDNPAFVPARHFQNHLVPRDEACFTCHTDYTMFGDLHAKVRGLKHLYVQYLGNLPKPEAIKAYSPYSNRECLHCHSGARSFEEAAIHRIDPNMLQSIRLDKLSCLTSGCHGFVHNVKELKDATFWKGTP